MHAVDITVGNMLKQVEVQPVHPRLFEASLDRPVYNGGPVSEDRGFILHKPKDYYESSIQMTDELTVPRLKTSCRYLVLKRNQVTISWRWVTPAGVQDS